MILSFHPCFDADVQIILGARALEKRDLDMIHHAHAIILPQGCSQHLYHACSLSDAIIFPDYDMRFEYPGKTGQSIMFKRLGYLHPKTLCWKTVNEFRQAYPHFEGFPHKLPFWVKSDKSHEAEGVFFLKDPHSLSQAQEQLTLQEKSGLTGFVTQEHIPSGGKVLRAVIIGDHVVTYWKFPVQKGQVITTISRGATITHHWRPDLQAKGGSQAHDFSRDSGANVAAIDFAFPLSQKDPEPFFLEVNYFFGRRGLGGTQRYYHLLYRAVQDWLVQAGLNPKAVTLV